MGESNLNFENIPISALKNPTKHVIFPLLNPCKIISAENGLSRDWRGLAYLVGVPGQVMPSFQSSTNPMAEVLQFWSQQNIQKANFKQLQLHLEMLDRFDVLDDIEELLESDANSYVTKSKTNGVTNDSTNSVIPSTPDQDVLTVQDAYLSQQGATNPQMYDAFVLFADEDVDFAVELIQRMEAFGFTLCVKDRDLLGGLSSQHSAMLRLISERCNRLIIIISPDFFESPANKFFIDFAQALGIEQQRRKIVPCLYKRCTLPPQLSYYFLLDYQRSGKLWNFWDKLRDSLRTTPMPLSNNQRTIIRELESNVQSMSMVPKQIEVPKLAITNYAENQVMREQMKPEASTKPPLEIAPTNFDSLHLPDPVSDSLKHSSSLSNVSEDRNLIKAERTRYESMTDFTNINKKGEHSKKDRNKKSKWYKKLLSFNSSSRIFFDSKSESSVGKNKKKAVPVLAD